jgi:ribose transport system permease protein
MKEEARLSGIRPQRKQITNFLIQNSRFLVLLLLFVFFSLTTDTFFYFKNWGNVKNIIMQQAPFSILLAVSMTLIITVSGFDLSIGSAVAAVSCAAAIVMQSTQNAFLGIIFGLVLGALIGTVNGFLVAYINIPTFIATYSMQWILRGVALVILQGNQIRDFGPDFRNLFIGVPYTFLIICAAVVIILHFVLTRTVFGKEVYAVGFNRAAAELSGVRSKHVLMISFIISGTVVGLTALMYIANLGAAEATIGTSFNLDAIAATLVGGTVIGGGGGKVTNAVVGGLIMLVLMNGMIQLGVPPVWQQVVVGAVIVISMIAERGIKKLSSV